MKVNEVLRKLHEHRRRGCGDDKGEGLAATCKNMGNGQHMFLPLVACDKDRYNSLLPFAKILVKEGKKIKVIKLSNREDLGEITEK